MKQIKRSALVPFSDSQMFELVNNVCAYPEFVPYCQSAKEISRNGNEVIAQLDVAKSGIAKSFTTKNILHPPSSVEMHLVEGPFRTLTGIWRFIALDEAACKIELDLQFEFRNKLTALAFSSVFEQLAHSMVNAFCERAKMIYGERNDQC